MTSIVHIGDVHAAPGPRSADRWRAVDQIIREGLALEQLGAWLIPGDLFDALSTTEDRNAWDARLQRMADAAPVVIIYGNHDRPGDLDGFANLKAAIRST
jgi:predicted MPP superfamily phosphohydrolase